MHLCSKPFTRYQLRKSCIFRVNTLPSTSKSPHPTACRSLASSRVFSYATASIRRYWNLKSNQIQITLASAFCLNWLLDDNNEGSWIIVLTNRSPPSSMEGKLTIDGFSNSLSKRAVIRCSKTRCIQNYENIGFCEYSKLYNLFKTAIFIEDSFLGTWTKIDITSLGVGNTAVIVAASLRTVSVKNYHQSLILSRKFSFY